MPTIVTQPSRAPNPCVSLGKGHGTGRILDAASRSPRGIRHRLALRPQESFLSGFLFPDPPPLGPSSSFSFPRARHHRVNWGKIAAGMLALYLGSVSAGFAAEAAWSQWRGPHRDGTIPPTAPWPSSLDKSTLGSRWRVPLGPSYSGPLIAGGLVIVTEAKDQAIEAVLAFDRETGKERWRHAWEGYLKVPFFAKSNGDWIRSTAAFADGRIYVGGMRDLLICLDATEGRELWRYDFPKELGKALPDFGLVSSPLVVEDAVYIQAGAGFAKLDRSSGKLLWRTLDDGGGMWGSAFGSPVRATLAGVDQLLVQTRDKLAGVAPADGKVLWEQAIKSFRGMNILTPTTLGDRLLTSSYGGQTQGWTVTRDGATWTLKADWSLKLEAYMSSPVVYQGHAYLQSRSQHLVCIDMTTGAKRWQSESKFGKYMSLVARGDQGLALDERGLLILFRLDPEKLETLGERRIADAETWAHLAVAGQDLVVRDLQGVTLWSWK